MEEPLTDSEHWCIWATSLGKLSSVYRDSPTQIHLLSPISTSMNVAKNFREKELQAHAAHEPIVAMFLKG